MESISNALERCLIGPPSEMPVVTLPPDDDSATIFYNLPPEPPLEAFPAEIRQMLRQASVSFKHAPIEVPLVGFLSLLSICIGRSRTLEIKGSWQETGNIYIALVGDSGVGKSHCFNAMLKPVWDEDFQCKQEWEAALARYNEIMDARSKDKAAAAMTEPPSKPIRTQYLIEDATIEAIGQTMSENPRGLLWVVDELAGLIGSLDRYSSGKSDSGVKARIISAYDSLPWKTSRSDRDKNQSSSATFLSITSTTQPEILKGLFSRRDALSGFLPRFMFIMTKRRRPSFLTEEVFTGQALLEKIARHMLAWEMNQDNDRPLPKRVKLSAEAYSIYEDWHNQKAVQAWEHEGIEQMIAPKLTTQVLHLALLLHCLKAALDGADGLAELSGETMREAITLGDWIGVHQMRVWSLLGLDQEEIVESLDEAVIMVCLGLEGFLKANGWKISNEDFNRKVADKYGQAISSTKIGKAASRLGIKSVYIGKKRGKELSSHLLKAFKAGHHLSTCRQRRNH